MFMNQRCTVWLGRTTNISPSNLAHLLARVLSLKRNSLFNFTADVFFIKGHIEFKSEYSSLLEKKSFCTMDQLSITVKSY